MNASPQGGDLLPLSPHSPHSPLSPISAPFQCPMPNAQFPIPYFNKSPDSAWLENVR
ncbi:MAG: hypothetical protein F6J93_26810 [Oscillatoria sp. SIO1A7]|nr:hypothetical protein [Oscillatoria sp. SIO1A7]